MKQLKLNRDKKITGVCLDPLCNKVFEKWEKDLKRYPTSNKHKYCDVFCYERHLYRASLAKSKSIVINEQYPNASVYVMVDLVCQANEVSIESPDDKKCDYIENLVADFFKVDLAFLKSKSRKREYVVPRQITMHLMKLKTRLSLVSIGRRFNKDHSTAIYSIEQVSDLMATDKKYKAMVTQLKAICKI